MARTAVLIFAGSLRGELSRKHLGSSAARALRAPFVHLKQAPSAARVDYHLFTTDPHAVSPALRGGVHTIHRQRGRGFAARLENAVDDLVARGYGQIVIVGRDCPELAESDISSAIEALKTHRAVLGPDHRGGCWLIGFKIEDRELLRGINWQAGTDFSALRARVTVQACAVLAVKLDIDNRQDWFAAALRLALAAEVLAHQVPSSIVPLFARILSRVRIAHQLPPPLAA